MASFTDRSEEQYGKLMRFWSKRYTALYAILALFSGYVVADLWLPPVMSTSTVERMSEHTERHTTSRKYSRPKKWKMSNQWAVLHLANGMRFQMGGSFGALRIGDTLEVEATPWREHVLRYRTPTHVYKEWRVVSERSEETNLYPVLVLIASGLLLLPVRSVQYRWIMHFVLLLTFFPWLLTLIGTEGLTLLY
jgi:hypothetical protein